MASAETQARIEEDAREATRHDFDGTPLVLVNGRKGASYGPFLYAMVLTRGAPDHPAFAVAPRPTRARSRALEFGAICPSCGSCR